MLEHNETQENIFNVDIKEEKTFVMIKSDAIIFEEKLKI
jgi:hypothetical protein